MCGWPITLPLLISFFYYFYKSNRSKNLKLTLPWCLLLSFLHNRIPCKQNAWAANNLAPLHMPFLSIIAYNNKPNKCENHTSTFVYHLLFVKIEFHFYLEKNWFDQNQSSTVSADPTLYQ